MRTVFTVTIVAALLVQAVRLAVGFQLTDGIPLDPILRHDVLGILGFVSAVVISGAVGLLMLYARHDPLVRYGGWVMAVVAGIQMSASHLAIMGDRSMQEVLRPAYLATNLPSLVLSVSFAVSIDCAIVLVARLYRFVGPPESVADELEREVQLALGQAREDRENEHADKAPRCAGVVPATSNTAFELTCPECGEWSTGERESRLLAVRALGGHRGHCVARKLRSQAGRDV